MYATLDITFSSIEEELLRSAANDHHTEIHIPPETLGEYIAAEQFLRRLNLIAIDEEGIASATDLGKQIVSQNVDMGALEVLLDGSV